MNQNDKETQKFQYVYSAKEQQEINRIRKKYIEPEEDKMARLKRLDAMVTQRGQAVSLSVGIIGALLLGIGMCCCMLWNLFVLGIIIGVIGFVPIALAHPLYHFVIERERKKIAPEILKLTDELLK